MKDDGKQEHNIESTTEININKNRPTEGVDQAPVNVSLKAQ